MNRNEFWELIDKSKDIKDSELQIESIRIELEKLPLKDIEHFDQHMWDLMAESYTWDLWGAVYLINEGCSDDSFDYFREWLIPQGREVFEKAVLNPDSLADFEELTECEVEELLSLANEIYLEKTGKELPINPIKFPELGEEWDFDDNNEMKKRFPKLYARFDGKY